MDIRKLQRAIVDGLEDVKAQGIVVFNTESLSPLFERVIIASGTSNRQTKALASSVRETVKKRGLAVLRTEGEENGEWIIVDCGAAVAHIMQPAIRDYYRLEEIWGGKTVRLKAAPTARTAPKPAKAPEAGMATATRRASKAAKAAETDKQAKQAKTSSASKTGNAPRTAKTSKTSKTAVRASASRSGAPPGAARSGARSPAARAGGAAVKPKASGRKPAKSPAARTRTRG